LDKKAGRHLWAMSRREDILKRIPFANACDYPPSDGPIFKFLEGRLPRSNHAYN
jgi:hypothetical protein